MMWLPRAEILKMCNYLKSSQEKPFAGKARTLLRFGNALAAGMASAYVHFKLNARK